MTKKILVTGGTGFIGSALVKRLVKEGYTVRVLDNDIRGRKHRLTDIKDKIEIVSGDIRDYETVKKSCEGMDSVFHLAYINGTAYFYEKPELVLEVGVKGIINVLDACIHHNIKEFLIMSSSEAYQHPKVIPTPEDVPLVVPDPHNPRYSYGSGKIISELMSINYGKKYFDRTLIIRPHNVYGPDMGNEHVIPQFARRMNQLIKEQSTESIEFPIQGTGKETRAFVHIDDFIDGVMTVYDKGENLEIYNVGTDEEVSIRQVAKLVGEYFGKNTIVKEGDLTKGSTPRRCPDITKVRKLGYTPQITLAQGIKKTVPWYLQDETT